MTTGTFMKGMVAEWYRKLVSWKESRRYRNKVLSHCHQTLHAKWLMELSYVNLNLVKCQLQNISQQKDIENGILLPISNGIFSSLNVPNLKPLFLGFDTSLNYGTEKFRTFHLFYAY